eukprot:TRINITY_DN1735_c0_g1_i1.p5 TRINITY_DN1735_c0_g1~~TRINITY_DN1735_c0_g1_i1.p5  ORF type:complete len:73 (+),score=29.77 TRINITY_DN1735_c0_g1_i1:666-884(+)
MGLKYAVENNGKTATVLEWLPEKKRYKVQIGEQKKKFKSAKLDFSEKKLRKTWKTPRKVPGRSSETAKAHRG